MAEIDLIKKEPDDNSLDQSNDTNSLVLIGLDEHEVSEVIQPMSIHENLDEYPAVEIDAASDPLPEDVRQLSVLNLSFLHVFRETLKTGLSFTCSNALNTAQDLGSVFILKVSVDPLEFGAYSLINIHRMLTLDIFSCPLNIGAILIGNDAAADQSPDDIARILQSCLIVATFFSIPAIVFLGSSKYFFMLLGEEEDIANAIQDFMWGFLPGVVPYFLGYASRQFFRGLNRTVYPVLVDAAGTVLFLGAAQILINGNFGLPRSGIRGLGYSFSISAFFRLACDMIMFAFAPSCQLYRLYKPRFSWYPDIKRLLRLGLPFMMDMMGENISRGAMGYMVATLSLGQQFAFNIATIYESIFLIGAPAFFQATAVLVSRYIGAKQFKSILPCMTSSFSLLCLPAATSFAVSVFAFNQIEEFFMEASRYLIY